MNEIRNPMIPYLELPFGEMDDVDRIGLDASNPHLPCLETSIIENSVTYQGHVFFDRTLEKVNHIQSKLLPSFEEDPPKTYDFGFGPKAVNNVFLKDCHRMLHGKIPKNETIGPGSLKNVLSAIFRLSGYDDDRFHYITRLYNQRIGVDLYRLACFSVDPEIQTPVIKDHHKNLCLSSYKENIYIEGKIHGKIYDVRESAFIPVLFEAKGSYNLTKDICKHQIQFELNLDF